jgi:cysteinyl-tRNA synthetase
MEKFPAGESSELQKRANAARLAFEEALDDNLNTAEALAAVFDLVRDVNTAMDRGQFHDGDRPACLDVLEKWDRISGVLDDNDHFKLRHLGFVKELDARGSDSTDQIRDDATKPAVKNTYTTAVLVESLSDEEVATQISARNAARQRGDFSHADQIRQELLKAGIMLEDTKGGTRWKRK